METVNNVICSTCKVHTVMYKEFIHNGRYVLKCCECDTKRIFEPDGTELTHEQLLEEKEQWL